MWMKRTSVYLGPAEAARLAELAARTGQSQAAIIRAAIIGYEPGAPNRDFELFKAGERGPGGSVADQDDHGLLTGFGE